MTTVRDRWRVLLPVTAATMLGLGALIYSGSYGTTCDGTKTTPVMVHPPFPWPWYVGLAVVILGACVSPLLAEWRHPRHPG